MASRVLLFTGKGGVGKTTLSAATAAACAARGARTLVLSADPAHSLGDVFRARLGPRPRELAENLHAQEIDVPAELERHWGAVGDFLGRFFESSGMDPLRAAELAVLPGMDEAVALLAVEEAARGDWDVVVLDCAPTGATARLLALPEASRWYMERVFPLEKKVVGTLAPVLERTSGVPMPRGIVFDAVSALHRRLAAAGALLADPRRSALRLVANPERMAVRETQRACTMLQLFGFPVDAVLANKVLPREARAGFFARHAKAQAAMMKELTEAFWFLPVVPVELAEEEVAGVADLAELGARVHAGKDPARALAKGSLGFAREKDGYSLSVALPRGARGTPDVFTDGEELVIAFGKTRRSLAIPRALAALTPAKAVVSRTRLTVSFR
ncbi:MAG TPA: TRC40/GET3/ArsA family transport-energizing ATPase [bacterium]|nr:TRC40/GET3/ArsA family transport-energizing ATPase [bacterium]